MAASRFLLLLQLGAIAAASSLLLFASRGVPVDAALPPPMMSRDASATTDAPRTVYDGGVAAAAARRLGTPHALLRHRLSDDIPAAALDDDDISADAPDAADDYDYGYEIPAADAPEWLPDAAGDYYYDVAPADAPAAASLSSGSDGDVGAEADEFPSTNLDYALLFLAVISGSIVVSFLVVGLLTCAASLPSYVSSLYAAAKTAREKATQVRPLDDH